MHSTHTLSTRNKPPHISTHYTPRLRIDQSFSHTYTHVHLYLYSFTYMSLLNPSLIPACTARPTQQLTLSLSSSVPILPLKVHSPPVVHRVPWWVVGYTSFPERWRLRWGREYATTAAGTVGGGEGWLRLRSSAALPSSTSFPERWQLLWGPERGVHSSCHSWRRGRVAAAAALDGCLPRRQQLLRGRND